MTQKQEEIQAGHAAIKRLGSEIEKVKAEMVKLTKKRDKVRPESRSCAVLNRFTGARGRRQDPEAGSPRKGALYEFGKIQDPD